MIWEVYSLTDPRNGKIRYVGVTRLGIEIRAKGHMSGHTNARMRDWTTELKKQNKTVRIEVLERVETGLKLDALNREKHWIKKLIRDGHSLFNMMCTKEDIGDDYRAARARDALRRARESVARCERELEAAKARLVLAIERDANGGRDNYR